MSSGPVPDLPCCQRGPMDSPHPQPDDTQRLLDDYTDKPAPTPLTFEPPPPSGSTFAVARNVIFNIRHRLFWASHRVRGLRLYAIGLVALIACMTIQFEPFAVSLTWHTLRCTLLSLVTASGPSQRRAQNERLQHRYQDIVPKLCIRRRRQSAGHWRGGQYR